MLEFEEAEVLPLKPAQQNHEKTLILELLKEAVVLVPEYAAQGQVQLAHQPNCGLLLGTSQA